GTRGTRVSDRDGNTARVFTADNVHLLKLGLNYKLTEGLAPWSTGSRSVPIIALPPATANWTGVYVGAHAGCGWGQAKRKSAEGALAANSSSTFAGSGTANGFAIGGQFGANYQIGPWVTGVEADASWSDLDGNAKCATPEDGDASSFTCHTRIN